MRPSKSPTCFSSRRPAARSFEARFDAWRLGRGPALALGALLFGGSACCRLGADDVGADAGPKADASVSSSAVGATPTAPAAEADAAPSGSAAPPAPTSDRQIAGAAHILIAYKGAELAPKTVTRSKEDARKRAEEVLSKLQTNKGTFAELAGQYSDDPSKIAGGAIGNFERNAMPPAFSDATFGLDVGAMSGIVETPRGFHIIQRTR
jgi:hypothetical protein